MKTYLNLSIFNKLISNYSWNISCPLSLFLITKTNNKQNFYCACVFVLFFPVDGFQFIKGARNILFE